MNTKVLLVLTVVDILKYRVDKMNIEKYLNLRQQVQYRID